MIKITEVILEYTYVVVVGRPIVTTDVPGCRETVIDGETGFLVPVRDVDLLAKRMIWFIENQDKINQMGQQSYAYCKDKFDVRKVNQRMCEIMGMHWR